MNAKMADLADAGKEDSVCAVEHGQVDTNDRLLKLPLSRVKTIMKVDPDVSLASQEAVVAIAKAAELFIGALSRDASHSTLHAKRKTLLKKDLETTMGARDCFAFLEGAIE